ncbi:MAG TPA: hypothetical protein VMX79_05915 [bacterium]|nr:hypothetical protein [bacterium]
MTYRLWLLEPGKEYRVRVEKFGSASEPGEPEGDVIYETHYHFYVQVRPPVNRAALRRNVSPRH